MGCCRTFGRVFGFSWLWGRSRGGEESTGCLYIGKPQGRIHINFHTKQRSKTVRTTYLPSGSKFPSAATNQGTSASTMLASYFTPPSYACGRMRHLPNLVGERRGLGSNRLCLGCHLHRGWRVWGFCDCQWRFRA